MLAAAIIGLACSAVLPASRPPPACQSSAVRLTRRAALTGLLLLPASAAFAAGEDLTESTGVTETGDVMHGVLQTTGSAALPKDGSVVVTMRVVGRNTKGPLATVALPIPEGAVMPFPFAVTRSDIREGVPDFLWAAEDLYVRADTLSASGKTLATGRSKAKAKDVDGAPTHGVAFTTME